MMYKRYTGLTVGLISLTFGVYIMSVPFVLMSLMFLVTAIDIMKIKAMIKNSKPWY